MERSDFKFDKINMYRGKDYIVDNKFLIRQPTVGEIFDIGEQEFYSMLSVFVSNPTSYRLALWDAGVDWNKVSDYQLFCMLYKGADEKYLDVLVPDLHLNEFELYGKSVADSDEQIMTLYNPETEIELSEGNYLEMSEYIRNMFKIFPKVEKAKGRATKEAIIWEEKEKIQMQKNEPYKSNLFAIVSACVNHPGFKYGIKDLDDIGIVQLMDSAERLQVYESTTALLKGMYSGMIDSKNISSDAYNFMKEI